MTDREVFEQRRMAVANEILEHPERFDMETWGTRNRNSKNSNACGTTACLAGTAALLAEAQGLVKTVWAKNAWDDLELNLRDVKDLTTGKVQMVEDFAMDYLGMNDSCLFHRVGMDDERAAKALLEEPYVDDEIDS